jgi:hypothetical protein
LWGGHRVHAVPSYKTFLSLNKPARPCLNILRRSAVRCLKGMPAVTPLIGREALRHRSARDQAIS